MKISYWPTSVALNGKEPYEAVLNSIKRTDELSENDMDADAAIIWSVLWNGRMLPNKKVWDHYRSRGRPVIVVETGSLIRNQTWKLSANGIGNHAIWPDVHDNTDRATKLGVNLQLEKPAGENVLICLQHSKSEQWKGMPTPHEWLRDKINLIQSIIKKPIIVRPHPRDPINLTMFDGITVQRPKKTIGDDTDFIQQLDNIGLVVCHNSNPAVLAAINGVKVRCSESCLAHPVSIGDWTNYHNPMVDRTKWFNDILHTEWTTSELKTGLPWRGLRKLLK